MGRPAKHDEATRIALLDASERLLAEGGAEAVSVRAAAELIGQSTRAVYSVFGSKESLLKALAVRGYDYLSNLLERTPVTDDPLDDLAMAGVMAFRRFAMDRPHLFQITFDRLDPDVFRHPEVSPELVRTLTLLIGKIGPAQQTGLLVELSAYELAFMFHSVCYGLAVNELSHQAPPVGVGLWTFIADADLERLWTTTLTAFVNGLRRT